VASKSDDTDSTANHREVKYSERRAKETKLKKIEELIKQKEKAAQEVNNNRTTLESRCQELESRNCELEETVKTLMKRIVKTLMKRIESLELQTYMTTALKPTKAIVGHKTMQTSLVIMTAWQTISTTSACVCTRSSHT
jgi:predicted nuclease with TOPRIM domain